MTTTKKAAQDGPNRPTALKVLTQVYKIEYLDENEWYQQQFDNENVGTTSRDQGRVCLRVDSSTDENSMRSTLLHELLHTVTQATRLDRYLKEVEDPEEFIIGQMSPVLLAVLNDNPDVLAYLLNVG